MTTTVRNAYELGSTFSFADRLRAPAKLAYVEGMKVVVHDLHSGRRRHLYADQKSHMACPLAWRPDGRVLFHSHDGQIVALDVARGTAQTLTCLRGAKGSGVHWQLHCSPDGSRLLFLHGVVSRGTMRSRVCTVDLDGGALRVACGMERLWSFACSWKHDLLLVAVGGDPPTLWRMDLDGRHPRRVSEGALVRELQIASDGTHALYELQGGVWSLDLRTGKSRRVIERGGTPALSPHGSAVAFTRDDNGLYIQPIDGRTKTVLRPRERNDGRRFGSYAKAPVWSRDGSLLLFSTTLSRRHVESLHPEFVAAMLKRKAAAERRSPRGLPPGRHASYQAAIEHAHWAFTHFVGLVDFQTRKVWMREGRWDDVAWAPIS